MDLDQVGETQLAGEPVRAAEGLGGEGGQVVDVLGPAGAEERLEQRVGQDAVVEDLLEAVQPLLATGTCASSDRKSVV